MGFHYASELKKFTKEWERLEKNYREAGMTDEQIQSIREYDWQWFCSQRTYQNRNQPLPSEQCGKESELSCLFHKFDSLSYRWDNSDIDRNRYGWLSTIEDPQLFQRLCKLNIEDLELLTLLFVDGYRQADVARFWKCSRSAVAQRLKKIINFLKTA